MTNKNEENNVLKRENVNYVTRKEYNILNLLLTMCILATSLFAWRVATRNNENIRNIARICDKAGIEYSVTTNHFGLRNSIILK